MYYKEKNYNYKRLYDLSSNQNEKPLENFFALLAARAVFVSAFLLGNHLIFD